MNQQHKKIGDVKVWQKVSEAAGKGPGEGHDEITNVVGMSTDSPPARYYQLGAPTCRHRLEVTNRGVGGISSELVLLGI